MAVFAKNQVAAFQACPEFLALVSEYPCHRPAQLISPTAYPTFQALESAAGFCLHGCVECVVTCCSKGDHQPRHQLLRGIDQSSIRRPGT